MCPVFNDDITIVDIPRYVIAAKCLFVSLQIFNYCLQSRRIET